MKFKRILFMFLISGILSSPALAYTDHIDATSQEIYDAAKVAFSKEGFYKQNPEKKSLTTKWIYKRIRRSRKRRFVPIQLQENVDLRYQMQVDVKDGKNYSDVSVVGRFQEKPTDAPPQQSWKNSPSSKELYFKEREYFSRILNSLEAQKKSALADSSQSR